MKYFYMLILNEMLLNLQDKSVQFLCLDSFTLFVYNANLCIS